MLQRWFVFLALSALVAAGCSDGEPGGVLLDAAAAAPADAGGSTGDAGQNRDGDAMSAEIGPIAGSTADAKTALSVDASPGMVVADAAARADAAVGPDAPANPAVVGPAGATLMLNEGRLFIPPGALAQNTTIVFRTVSDGFPEIPGNRAYSSVVSVEPHGQTFAPRIALTIYHFGGPAKVALYAASPNGSFTEIADAKITLNTAEAILSHFGYFVVAPVVVKPDAGPDAPRDTAIQPDVAATDTSLVADTAPPRDAADTAAPVTPDAGSPPDLATTPDASPDAPAAPDVPPDVGPDVPPDVAPDTAPPRPDGPMTVIVKVQGEWASFSPKVVRIKVGDTVTWQWEADNNHTVVSGGSGGVGAGACASDGKFVSGANLKTGDTFSHTFTALGLYGYHCAAHCSQFEGGDIIVE